MALKDKIVTFEDDMYNVEGITTLPCIALRGLVVFPHDVINFDVGRKTSLAAVEMAMNEDRTVFLVTQTDPEDENPGEKEIYKIGVIGKIRQILRLPDNCIRVLVEGIARAKIIKYEFGGKVAFATVNVLNDKQPRVKASYTEALVRRVHEAFEKFAAFTPKMPKDIKEAVKTTV